MRQQWGTAASWSWEHRIRRTTYVCVCLCVCVGSGWGLQYHWGWRLSKRLLLETAVPLSTLFAIIAVAPRCFRGRAMALTWAEYRYAYELCWTTEAGRGRALPLLLDRTAPHNTALHSRRTGEEGQQMPLVCFPFLSLRWNLWKAISSALQYLFSSFLYICLPTYLPLCPHFTAANKQAAQQNMGTYAMLSPLQCAPAWPNSSLPTAISGCSPKNIIRKGVG